MNGSYSPAEFAQRVLRIAEKEGYDGTNRVSLRMQFHDGEKVELIRVIVSKDEQTLGVPGRMWLNPETMKFKQAVYEDDSEKLSWVDLRNPEKPRTKDESINYSTGAGGDNGGGGDNEMSKYYGDPVQNIAALKAINTTSIEDKHVRFVEDESVFYALDKQSQADETEDHSVVQPSVGPGRWARTIPKVSNGGSF